MNLTLPSGSPLDFSLKLRKRKRSDDGEDDGVKTDIQTLMQKTSGDKLKSQFTGFILIINTSHLIIIFDFLKL